MSYTIAYMLKINVYVVYDLLLSSRVIKKHLRSSFMLLLVQFNWFHVCKLNNWDLGDTNVETLYV